MSAERIARALLGLLSTSGDPITYINVREEGHRALFKWHERQKEEKRGLALILAGRMIRAQESTDFERAKKHSFAFRRLCQRQRFDAVALFNSCQKRLGTKKGYLL